ncbi:hypothetical protein GJ496_008801 [Pomphorhynchus laevis]|nr:hypothetical protein GJ496_008801 [Pomphorhynchus laevis]
MDEIDEDIMKHKSVNENENDVLAIDDNSTCGYESINNNSVVAVKFEGDNVRLMADKGFNSNDDSNVSQTERTLVDNGIIDENQYTNVDQKVAETITEMLINTFIHEFDAEVENQNKLQVDQQNEQQVDFEAIKNHLEGQVENQDEHKIEQLHKSDKVCDGDNQKEIIKKESNNIDVKARSTALSEQEEDLKRFDVVSMINTLLDEEPTESSRKVSERPRSTRQFIGISDAPRPNNRIFRNTMLSVNENYHFNTEQISRPNFEYRNYRPPSQVKVQINCNGQPTVTSTSLQDFRRLIGLKDYPRKNYNHGKLLFKNSFLLSKLCAYR